MRAPGDGFFRDENESCRGRYCCELGCPGLGLWHPTILLHTREGLRVAQPVISDHHFCEVHRRKIRMDDFVTDEFWTGVVRRYGSTGPAPPARGHCQMVFMHKTQLLESDIEEL